MGRYFDFDAAWEEQAAKRDAPKPHRVKVLGDEWDLHAEIPAAAYLLVNRMTLAGDRELTDSEKIEYLANIVPGPVYDAWMSRGLSVRMIDDLIPVILALYLQPDPGAGDEGGAEAQGEGENGSPSPSSPTGPPSRPTSYATTAST